MENEAYDQEERFSYLDHDAADPNKDFIFNDDHGDPLQAVQAAGHAHPSQQYGQADVNAPSMADRESMPIVADEDTEADLPHPSPGHTTLVPPPDFRPFFTLIEDPVTGEHHHPIVHYVFSDDDPELLTSACLGAIERSTNAELDGTNNHSERLVIVDMDSTGKDVTALRSLSPDWQALAAKIAPAPSWNGDEDGGTTAKGLMLRISGQQSTVVDNRAKKPIVLESLEEIHGLLHAMDEHLAGLDSVLDRAAADGDVQQQSEMEAAGLD